MKIFILGCGFVGSKLALHFKEKGHLVTVTTTSPSKVSSLESLASEVVLLDERTDLKDCLVHQDVLIVCAAPKSDQDYKKAYLETAHRVKDALQNNSYVKAVFYTSSCSVYGEKEGKWVDETHALQPANPLQEILAETEKVYLNQLPPSTRVCIFRLGEIYGLEKCMSEKVKKMSGTRLKTTGQSYTNLIHVKDIIRALDWAMHKKLSGVFNLCNDTHETRCTLYQKWCEFLGVNLIEFTSECVSSHRGNKRVSNHKIKLMGFEFEHPFADPAPQLDEVD